MSIRPELRHGSKSHKPTPEQKKAHNKLVADASRKKQAPKARPHADLGPWAPRQVQSGPTPPAQRDPRAVECPSPRFDARYQCDPAEVPRLFSALRPGQYISGEAA